MLNKKYKIMLSAGESSADMHGALLVQKLKEKLPQADFFALGGERLKNEGVELVAHLEETAVMGLVEVLGSLKRIMGVLKRLKAKMQIEKPDILILIDLPDFNFKLAKMAYKLNIPVVYYIGPQVWAWRASRLKFLKKYTQRRALLFEFEKKFYEAHGLSADWVGHPILDNLPAFENKNEAKKSLGFPLNEKLFLLMPGSRKSVLKRLAPLVLETAQKISEKYPEVNLVLAQADSVSSEEIKAYLALFPVSLRQKIKIMANKSKELLAAADAALLVSGTSTVEATFLNTPMAVVYKVNKISWFLAKILIKIPYVSITNLLLNKEAVPEFLQNKATVENLFGVCQKLLFDEDYIQEMHLNLKKARKLLGGKGATDKVCQIVLEELKLT